MYRLAQTSIPVNNVLKGRNRANRLLGFIASIKSRRAEVILKYLALVRPHLDYEVQFWSLQRRMTKMIEGIRNFSYERRLKLLKLYSLE